MIREALPASVSIVDPQGRPNRAFTEWLSKTVEGQVADLLAVQAIADTAVAAAADAQAAADTAATAAASAQTAADNAQATADAIVTGPTGSTAITTSTVVDPGNASVLADATGGPITVGLPDAAQFIGPIVVTKIDASANAVTIDATGTDTINGGAPVVLTAQYDSGIFTADGFSAWYG